MVDCHRKKNNDDLEFLDRNVIRLIKKKKRKKEREKHDRSNVLINKKNFHEIIHRSFPCFRTPTGLEDVSKYPELFAELLARGWSERDIQKLAGLNLIRVFKAVEKVNFFFQNRVVKKKKKRKETPLSSREKK